jgi:hypothetical protein
MVRQHGAYALQDGQEGFEGSKLAAGVPGWQAAGGANTGGDSGTGSGIATIPRFSLGEQYTSPAILIWGYPSQKLLLLLYHSPIPRMQDVSATVLRSTRTGILLIVIYAIAVVTC